MISIIIPTYNEKNSILNTIKELKTHLKVKHEILVMDDDSKDLTWKIVNDAKIPFVKAIRRTKNKSLSKAVIEGFENAKYENILVMDGDGQHDPKIIPLMLNEIKTHDFVSASRYIKGGSTKNWPIKRKITSKTATILSKLVLNQKITDPMSGFFLTKKSVYEQIKQKIKAKGYKIYLEMLSLYEQKTGHVKIKEIPYKFRIRKQDESKLKTRVIINYIQSILSLFILRNKKILKFLTVGLIGTILNTALLFLLTEKLNLYYVLSGIIATELAIINNFLFNNFWTWKKTQKKHSFIKRLASYNTVSIMGLIITITTLFALTEIGLNYILSNLIGIILATTWNYTMNNNYTFKSI
jgi:dolichol-phosphate mannosyltransferase